MTGLMNVFQIFIEMQKRQGNISLSLEEFTLKCWGIIIFHLRSLTDENGGKKVVCDGKRDTKLTTEMLLYCSCNLRCQ